MLCVTGSRCIDFNYSMFCQRFANAPLPIKHNTIPVTLRRLFESLGTKQLLTNLRTPNT